MTSLRPGVAFVAIVLASLPVQLGLLKSVGEPYPGLFMPGFGGVPVDQGRTVVQRLELQAETPYGPVLVEPASILPNRTLLAESIASSFFRSREAVESAARSGWIRDRLLELGLDASALDVRISTDYVGRDGTLETVDVDAFSVDLATGRD